MIDKCEFGKIKKYPISWQIPLRSIAKINFAAIVGSAFDEPVTLVSLPSVSANIRPRCRSIPFIRTVSLRLDHSISRVSGTNSGKGWTLSLFLDHPAKEQNDDAITE
jgi:hypothetical protein